MQGTYVVTGGAGFIGSHIAERLLRDGHCVRVLDDLSSGKAANLAILRALNGDLHIHQSSILERSALPDIFSGADVIFHQAALSSVARSIEDPFAAHEQCATGTLNVLQAAKDSGVRRVVYAASASAYGDDDTAIQQETAPANPLSPYAAAKLAGEFYCRMFYHTYGLETVALRYFNVFGERQDPASDYAAVIPVFITRMLAGDAPVVNGSGEQTRDFIHVANVVHGNLLAADAPHAAGTMMNLATGERTSLLQLIRQINAILGEDIAPQYTAARPADVMHSRASIVRAQELLGYAPIVSFEEGLRRTVAWYRQQLQADSD